MSPHLPPDPDVKRCHPRITQPPWLLPEAPVAPVPPAPAASPPAPPPPGSVMLLPLLSCPRSQAHRLRPARTQLPSGARQKPPQTHAKSFWRPLGRWPICGVLQRGVGVLRPPEGTAGGLGVDGGDVPSLGCRSGIRGCGIGAREGRDGRAEGGTCRRVGEAALTFNRSLYWDGVCSASDAPSVPRSLERAALAERYAGAPAVG